MNWLRYGKKAVNLDLVRRIEWGDPDHRNTEGRREAVRFEMSDGRAEIAWDDHARALIPAIEALCGRGETTPPATIEGINRTFRGAALEELEAIAAQARRVAEVADSDTGSPRHVDLALSLADRIDGLARAIDQAESDPPVYRILDPAGRRSGPDGDVLLEARDLGELRDCAESVSRSNPTGVYPIVVTGPDRESVSVDGVWAELRVDGPDSWEVRAEDGTVVILPGAFIL